MIKLKNLIGLCALLLSFQASSSEINIQDVWIRPLTSGQADAMVGMVINSTAQARIISVISPAYMSVAIHGPVKGGANLTEELEFIDLPAQVPVVLGAEGVHLLLSGSRQKRKAADKVPIIVTVQFDDQSSKTITVTARSVLNKKADATPLSSNVAAEASIVVPPTEPSEPVNKASKVEAKHIAPSPQPDTSKAKSSPAKPVATSKPIVAAPKPVPAPVSVPVPLPVLVAPSIPVAAVTTSVAPLIVEKNKTPEAKPAEQHKLSEAKPSEECYSLVDELKKCDQSSNDILLTWCENNAKSKFSCPLTMQQLKKLGKQQSR